MLTPRRPRARASQQVPNVCTTLGVPVDIFDFDIMPGAAAAAAVQKRDMGSCAFASS